MTRRGNRVTSTPTSRRRRIVCVIGLLLVLGAASLLSFLFGREWGTHSTRMGTIATSWSEGTKYPVWYGAIVWTKWNATGTVDVHADIMIGEPLDGYPTRHHIVGMIATEPTPATAIKNWGQIVWTDTDVTIGAGGPRPVVITRKVIQSHR
jgi:hypothetical protein